MATHKESIRNMFVASENRWMFTGEIVSSLPMIAKQSVYSNISALFKDEELQRRQAAGGFEYSLTETVFDRAVKTAANRAAVPPKEVVAAANRASVLPKEVVATPVAATVDAEHDGRSENSVPVIEVPEGVTGRKRHVTWEQVDKEEFALNYARELRDNPASAFSALSYAAMRCMPEDKQRPQVARVNLPWFEHELERAKKRLHAMDQAAEEETRMRQMAEDEARKHQAYTDAARNMPNEMFMAEVMRRGASLIETMFIQALGSPRVRESLQQVFAPSIRQQPRHDPAQDQTEERPKLKKVLVYGLNKPVQQNEIKNTFGEMFDLRFLAVRANPGQLKAQARPADIVLILKDHVNHSDVNIIIANSNNYKRIDGGIGNLRAELHAMNS